MSLSPCTADVVYDHVDLPRWTLFERNDGSGSCYFEYMFDDAHGHYSDVEDVVVGGRVIRACDSRDMCDEAGQRKGMK